MNTHTKPPDAGAGEKLTHALALAKRGFFIAPLMPFTKLPYAGESWKKLRTRDPEQIRAWFRDRPSMNYAASPGEEFVILDLDTKKGKDGAGDLEALAVENGDFRGYEETFTVSTPSGGQHRYFKAPLPCTNANTLPKSIDVRGADGYVVGPGCHTTHNAVTNTAGGEYVITKGGDIAPLPEWIGPHLTKWSPDECRQRYDDRIEEIDGSLFVDGVELDTLERVTVALDWLAHGAKPAVEFEGGNNKTFATFAWLREHGISADRALSLVTEYYNPRCSPPWSHDELERIRDNAYRYAKREVSHAGGMESQFCDEAEIIATSQDVTALERVPPERAPKRQADDLKAHTWTGAAMFNRPGEKEFVIPRVLPASGYVGFLARRGTGKTTIMTDMALRLAHDMDWHGQPMKSGWGALVLAGEDPEGAKEQVDAWLKMHGRRRDQLSERFVFMDTLVDLLSADSVSKWLEHFAEIARGRRFVVFADTWQIATAGGSQNDDDTMQTAIANTKRIAEAVKGPAVMAAHPPKGNEDTWSGAAVMENHSQALWKLARETFGLKFTVPRIKGTRADFYALFDFKTQMLGRVDEWGVQATGIVPVKIAGEGHAMAQGEQARQLTMIQAVASAAYDILLEAEEARGDGGPATVWSGRSMSNEIVRRHSDPLSPIKLPDDPGRPDTLARAFPAWFENKTVEVYQRGPEGARMGVRMVKAGGNRFVFEHVRIGAAEALPDTLAAE